MCDNPMPEPQLLTVALCTHNPRPDFLQRTIEGLRSQTLLKSSWTFLIVDNNSTNPLCESMFAWDGNLQVCREDRLGLVHARLAAIDAAKTDLIVFVDDDNVLDPDYLAECVSIGNQFPRMGAWGGQTRPDFIDGQPEEWTRRWWGYLAISGIGCDFWSSDPVDNRFIPFGAGLVVRRDVAERYAEMVRQSPQRRQLDRVGTALGSCGDTDLALTAVDLGYGVGRFQKLQMIHIIPGGRLTESYLTRLVKGTTCSAIILNSLRPSSNERPPVVKLWRDRLRDLLYGSYFMREIVSPQSENPGGVVKMLNRFLRVALGENRLRNMSFLVAGTRGQLDADKHLSDLSATRAHSLRV